jgi:hypothetical protein
MKTFYFSINYHLSTCMKVKQKIEKSNRVRAQRWSPTSHSEDQNRRRIYRGVLCRGWSFTSRNGSQLEQAFNALYTEAQDMLRAAFMAAEMGCQSVICETDSAVLKQAVTTEEFDMSMLGAIFRDIKFLLP